MSSILHISLTIFIPLKCHHPQSASTPEPPTVSATLPRQPEARNKDNQTLLHHTRLKSDTERSLTQRDVALLHHIRRLWGHILTLKGSWMGWECVSTEMCWSHLYFTRRHLYLSRRHIRNQSITQLCNNMNTFSQQQCVLALKLYFRHELPDFTSCTCFPTKICHFVTILIWLMHCRAHQTYFLASTICHVGWLL